MNVTTQSYPYLSDLVRAATGLDLPLPIPMFGLFVLVAVLVAGWVLRLEMRRRFPDRDVDEWTSFFAMAMMLAGVVGARLFSIAEDPGRLVSDPSAVLVSRNGFNIIGGLVVATAVGVWLVRRAGYPVAQVLDAAAPSVMLGYAVGRIGCQVSGDGDWGLPANLSAKPGWVPTWLWAQTYEGNILGQPIPAPGVYPTPIWETIGCLALFLVLWRLRRHSHRYGWLFAMFMVLASLERLAIEPLRVNETHPPFGWSQAQYLSLLFFVLGLALLARTWPERDDAAAPERGTAASSV